MFITPKFWYKSTSLSYILLPLSLVFFILSKVRILLCRPVTIPNKFVICIGNATIGGTGKTPAVIAIATVLKKKYNICILTKGYGRKTKGFFKIEEQHTVQETGDEPQVLHQVSTVYLYSNTNDIKKNYHKITEDIIIMDDGMQNSIIKDFVIMIIGRRGFGNGMIFPAGPLRENITDAIKKSSVILYTNTFRIPNPLEIKTYTITHSLHTNASKVEQYIAFSGLGDNQKFVLSLQEQGFNVLYYFDFKDHHSYKVHEIQKIIDLANKYQCKIITTEKDFVKIPANMQNEIFVLHIKYNLEDSFVQDVQNKIQASL